MPFPRSNMQLQDLLRQVSQLPSLPLEKLFLFIRFAQVCTPYIQMNQRVSSSSPPEHLPHSIRTTLSAALRENQSSVDKLWVVLRDYIWTLPSEQPRTLHADEISTFNHHALPQGTCESPILSRILLLTIFFCYSIPTSIPSYTCLFEIRVLTQQTGCKSE